MDRAVWLNAQMLCAAQQTGPGMEMADAALTPLHSYGLWAMAGIFAVLFAFIALRGRVPIEPGWGGMTIQRFTGFERACHWLLALSFLGLAVTGLAQLYAGPLRPLLGTEMLAALQPVGGPLHNSLAFVFTLTLAVAFLLWLRHSWPGWRDAVWFAKAGGMLMQGSTPPAGKFNGGQKILFWLIVLGGIGMIMTGAALLAPYRTGLVSKTFGLLAATGFALPTDATNLTPAQEVQYARLWHGALAIGLLCVAMVHIYMRTLGIQGALSAMTSGRIDVNRARQQHSLWAERELQRMQAELPATATPAE
jgi:formate dehydrogenase subunit gamma